MWDKNVMETDLKKAGYASTFEPNSLQDLIDICVGKPNLMAAIYMWRGQANIGWFLHSSAYRRLSENGIPDERSVIQYENRLLETATHRGFRYDNGRELTDFELLARLQHHGAATRLLDATRSVLVALYFAYAELPEKDGCLFGISTDSLGGGERSLLREDYETAVTAIADYNHSQTWQAPDVSPRVAAQHSQFLYSALRSAEHGTLAIDNPAANLITIRIASRLKQYFLLQLDRAFDINMSTLFPDLDGFGKINAATQPRWSAERW